MLPDLKSPRRSGFEVLENVRANDDTKLTLVIVLTPSNQEDDIRRAYDAGANSCLSKPVGEMRWSQWFGCSMPFGSGSIFLQFHD